MTWAAAVVIALGGLLLLWALELARRDLRDAEAARAAREESLKHMMAATKYVVSDWLSQATRHASWASGSSPAASSCIRGAHY